VSAAIASAIQSQQAKSALEQQRKERLELIKNLTTSGKTCMYLCIWVCYVSYIIPLLHIHTFVILDILLSGDVAEEKKAKQAKKKQKREG
jgi:hypothetical protein